jgi:hypothetical protein
VPILSSVLLILIHPISVMFVAKILKHAFRQSAAKSPFVYTLSRFARPLSSFPPPRLFDYETVTKNLSVADAIEAVEQAFSALAKGRVDVPLPMHIGIEESDVAGPGDCHIKGGYIAGTSTFTVKLAQGEYYRPPAD